MKRQLSPWIFSFWFRSLEVLLSGLTHQFINMCLEVWGPFHWCVDFPGGSVVKNLPASAGKVGSIPGSGRCPGGGNGNPLQYSCLEKSHGGRSLAGCNPWGCKRNGHDLVTKHQKCDTLYSSLFLLLQACEKWKFSKPISDLQIVRLPFAWLLK